MMQVLRAPKFVKIGGSALNADAKSIELYFEAADGWRFAMELGAEVLGPVMAAIQARSSDLRTSLPESESLPVQPLAMKDFQIAMGPDGSLGWQLILSSGVSVILRFSPEQFDKLDARFAEVREFVNRKVQ